MASNGEMFQVTHKGGHQYYHAAHINMKNINSVQYRILYRILYTSKPKQAFGKKRFNLKNTEWSNRG